MTMLGKTPWNKGKKMPHTREWEEKRLEAVRASAKTRMYRRGYTRPRTAIQPMLDGRKRARDKDPEGDKQRAIANLPKDCKGEKNGNWKGGKTKVSKDFRIRNSGRFDQWRKAVLARDGHKCKECGSVDRLEAHHLIPLIETHSTAFLVMNGVALCHDCHTKTDTYASKARIRRQMWEMSDGPVRRSPAPEQLLGRITWIVCTIPHRYQAYPTVGNWAQTDDRTFVVLVSDMGNEDYEFLVAVHEQIEAWLCLKRGITQKAVDEFDLAFERNRDPGNEDEPGCQLDAPYHQEHIFAESIERQVATELGVNWNDYEQAILSL